MGWTMGVLGFDSQQRLEIFLFTTVSKNGPPSLSNEYQRLFPWGVKRLGHEADYSPLVPRSRLHGAIPPLPKYAIMAWYSVKAQGQPHLLRIVLLDFIHHLVSQKLRN
jgi:hypothetical protein